MRIIYRFFALLVVLCILGTLSVYGIGVPTGRTIYLTFDDGPSAENTEAILDILKKANIHGTFFINGPVHEKDLSVTEWRRIVTRIHEEGHVIGNHTYDHEYSIVYRSPERFKNSILKLDQWVYETCGVHTAVFRFPGGSNTGFINRFSKMPGIAWRDYVPWLTQQGYGVFDWNVTSGDAAGKTVPRIVIQTYVKKGVLHQQRAIVLHHDSMTKITTVQALREEIRWMKANGYRFDTLDHLHENYYLSKGWRIR